jgi:hypothetical protein
MLNEDVRDVPSQATDSYEAVSKWRGKADLNAGGETFCQQLMRGA